MGRAVVQACQGRCWVVEGGRKAYDLSQPASKGFCHRSALSGRPLENTESADKRLLSLTREIAEDEKALETVHQGLDLLRLFICREKPAVVINCAGYTDVDKAETEPELAMAVNARGAATLAEACREAGSHLVHISTDYVFDGKNKNPYREGDEAFPKGAYGKSKLKGEKLVAKIMPAALIVRSAWIFGPGRPGFVDNVLTRALKGEPVRVVTDEVGSPTFSRDLAETLVWLAMKRVQGLLHVVNQGQASRYELARQALRLYGLDPDLVRRAQKTDLNTPAERPGYSVLDTRRLQRITGRTMPSWLDALGRYIALLKEDAA